MSSQDRVPAVEPEDLERLFVERVERWVMSKACVALYEPDAVMAVSARECGDWERGNPSGVRATSSRLGCS